MIMAECRQSDDVKSRSVWRTHEFKDGILSLVAACGPAHDDDEHNAAVSESESHFDREQNRAITAHAGGSSWPVYSARKR